MTTTKQKLKYFLDSFIKTVKFQGLTCPSCGHHGSDTVDRKYGVTRLLRCDNCKLLYRVPTTSDEEYSHYYQEDYSEGFTTDLPSVNKLKEMKDINFVGTEKDYSKYIDVLRALGCGDGDKLLDYGCSWGYGSWQFSQAGFVVKSFELSRQRAEFASRHLSVDVYSYIPEIGKIGEPFDIFFSAHVLEHVPKLSGVIDLAREVVRPGGLFIAYTPNGSSFYRNINPKGWHSSWGFVHPLVLDDVFYQSFFHDKQHLIDSYPYEISKYSAWASEKGESFVLRLDGAELLIAVRL